MVEQSESFVARGPNVKGNYERDADAHETIGTPAKEKGGGTTDWYRVVQDIYGSVMTMHPIPEPTLIPPG